MTGRWHYRSGTGGVRQVRAAFHERPSVTTGAKLLALVVAVVMTADCATFVSAGPSVPGASPPASVEVGDQVRVSMRNGDVKEVLVRAVESDGLVAEDGTFLRYSEISQIEKRTISATKTALLVVAIVGGVLVLLGAAYVSAADSFLGAGEHLDR